MTHFHCVHLHVISMFQTLMHLGSKCCKWCDWTVWSALGNMYHPHFQHSVLKQKVRSNLSTAPGCIRKPSVTFTWSKTEHLALSWGCSWVILYSGEDKVLMWLPQQFGLLLNTVLWIPSAGCTKCCELSVLLLALLNGTLKASLSVKVPCSINRKKKALIVIAFCLLQPLPHCHNESLKQKCWLSSFWSCCLLYYIGLCMHYYYCL